VRVATGLEQSSAISNWSLSDSSGDAEIRYLRTYLGKKIKLAVGVSHMDCVLRTTSPLLRLHVAPYTGPIILMIRYVSFSLR
jgi:hypothetical protein